MAESLRVILASASAARRHMLTSAGLTFDVIPADVDEAKFQASWTEKRGLSPPENLAHTLARAKAIEVSARFPDALVIGGDQVLALDDEIVSKAPTREAAKATLLLLRGRAHDLYSAVALAYAGAVLWSHSATAHMTVRVFSDAWLESYLDAAGHALTRSAGAYELEGFGAQLFEQVDGDYFTILGLPLLALLGELRRRGVIVQ